MVTKHQIKLIKSLSQKKYRNQEGLFIVEGIKGVKEFLTSDFELVQLYSTQSNFEVLEDEMTIISFNELKRISSLKNPNTVLALFKIPINTNPNFNTTSILLDDIRDPGNLGTIIRLCDWFGIEQLICSTNTVDCFNPKVVQASMGSLARVKIYYHDLLEFIKKSNLQVIGTFMEGNNVYTSNISNNVLIVLGNEANGISPEVEAIVDAKIGIPKFGKLKATESLNVANAAAIILSELKRRSIEM
ncbi:TrmH family RNA methyltransferase [Winogradskyella alexanderae]|uniref:RNA methyltransferase n=1 Tax=Winogradskyella alexanderae TaxID=2877123 RepID=A0ABS7XRP1_9FLAO|nr:RNA methyltransferase [Winogradskyella alexanderae]MCA0132420.1 RNA methyltransferase [Winogradskyella alexanderae]